MRIQLEKRMGQIINIYAYAVSVAKKNKGSEVAFEFNGVTIVVTEGSVWNDHTWGVVSNHVAAGSKKELKL